MQLGFASETGLDFSVFGRGIPKNGTVQPHPGFKNLGESGLLDYILDGNQLFANADFKASGYQVARIKITEVTKSVPEPFTTGAIGFGGLLILLGQVRRSMKRNPHLNLSHS